MVVYHFVVGGRPKPAPRMTQKSKWYNGDYMDYKKEIQQVAMLNKCNEAMSTITSPVVWVKVKVWGGQHGDWDNYGKTVCDALKHITWSDDKKVLFGAVEKELVTSKAQQSIEVWIADRKDLAKLLTMMADKELSE